MIVMQRLIKAMAHQRGVFPRKRWMKRSENNTAGKNTHIVPGDKLENFSKKGMNFASSGVQVVELYHS